ncbi:MAG TPA: alanine racemase [Stellaceae bacterium]|nr:alanine racemase [Stellaceae bacterium]
MASDPAARAAAILDIDLGAIVENWRGLAGRVMPAECAAVVKADAYGLGADRVADALAAAGCRTFFVATLDEGIALRAALGPAPEIAVFNGPLPGTAGEYPPHALTPVLNDPGQIERWLKLPCPPPAMLQVDTGMSRLGLSPREFAAVCGDRSRLGTLRWSALLSHLACADTPDHALNAAQLARFAEARRHFPGIRASLAASSGVFLGSAYHHDLVRPGAALYGVNPQPGRPNPMRQVVTLKGKIIQVRDVDRGESVGYGAAHVMTGPGRLATVAVGYADGWLRALSHRGSGVIAGQRVPLLGRVSMDLATFDVSAIDPVLMRPGDSIELLGPGYGVDDAARDAGTIGYEILTSLGRRYHRLYRAANRG